MSKRAQELRALDLRLGRIPASVQRDMQEDKEVLSIINAMYEVFARAEENKK